MSFLGRLLAFFSPKPPRPTPERMPDVRAAALVTTKRLRESSQASRQTGQHIREIARPIQELLREMGERHR